MISMTVSPKPLVEIITDGLVFFVPQDGFAVHEEYIIKNIFHSLKALMSSAKFTGKVGELLVVPASHGDRVVHLIFAGLGKQLDDKVRALELYRRTLGSIVRAAEKHKLVSIALELPNEKLFNISRTKLAEQTAATLRMACYYFDTYITNSDRKILPIDVTVVGGQDVQDGVEVGMIIGEAVNKARYWVDLPPSTLTPPELADKAKEIADQTGLKLTLFNEAKINELGMGGLAAVSRGSHQDCRLAILEYDCGDKQAPTIAYVGKGITFDSGGLSLKPASAMETMKEDMAGAAAVIGTMQAIGQLKPKINVVALMPLAENLPSGSAAKPGDIVRFYNGKTAEIKNTDAEGRLILADALAYAVKNYKPDAMIDIATLTGACIYAVGPYFTGMMSVDEDMILRLNKAAQVSGDAVWRLPLIDDYRNSIKSTVADVSNTGSPRYRAGTSTAGNFLQTFVDDTPWVHLDIGSTAFDVPDISYYRPGATGVGVRLLVEVAMGWK